MIKNFEELGNVLAEFENRISYLENSQGVSYQEPTVIEQGPQVVIHRYAAKEPKPNKYNKYILI